MALAKYLSTLNIRIQDQRTKIISFTIIVIPIIFILLQNDTGSALVYLSFIFVLYREGLSGNILLLGFLVGLLFILTLLIDKLFLIGILAGIAIIFFMVVRRNRKRI
jgi:rod shape determining protein RodA